MCFGVVGSAGMSAVVVVVPTVPSIGFANKKWMFSIGLCMLQLK
jgi:hypothetical protein